MANIITGIRIVLSVALLFFPVLSPAFFVLYVAGGLSDMIDGAAARRTGTVSEFGSRLDTFADIVFAAVCLIKLLPILDVPVWLYVWFAVIAIIKFSSITAGYIRQKKLVSVHSVFTSDLGSRLEAWAVFSYTTATRTAHLQQRTNRQYLPPIRLITLSIWR